MQPNTKGNFEVQLIAANQYMYVSIEQRILVWKSISTTNERGCWLFQGTLIKGYARVSYEGRGRSLHMLIWEYTNNCKLPKGKCLRHECRNTNCWNPEHLRLPTAADIKEQRRASSSRRRSIKIGTLCVTCGVGFQTSKYQPAKTCSKLCASKLMVEQRRLNIKPKDTKHWRTCRARARAAMEKHLGRKLGRREQVHHKDGDYTNNSLDNLEVLDPLEHNHRHHPDWEVPRHLRPARRAYMKAQQQNRRTLETICAGCGKKFLADRYAKSRYCSYSCGSIMSWKERRANSH